MKTHILKHCKDCQLLHTGGLKDGIHNRWCCGLGRVIDKAISHCKLTKLKQPKP